MPGRTVGGVTFAIVSTRVRGGGVRTIAARGAQWRGEPVHLRPLPRSSMAVGDPGRSRHRRTDRRHDAPGRALAGLRGSHRRVHGALRGIGGSDRPRADPPLRRSRPRRLCGTRSSRGRAGVAGRHRRGPHRDRQRRPLVRIPAGPTRTTVLRARLRSDDACDRRRDDLAVRLPERAGRRMRVLLSGRADAAAAAARPCRIRPPAARTAPRTGPDPRPPVCCCSGSPSSQCWACCSAW